MKRQPITNPVDKKYIIEAEQELGIVFPDSFKAKMEKENGGGLVADNDDWNLFPFFDKSDRKRISRTCNHIILETKRMKEEWRNFPNDGIAIASNGSGDFLILLPEKEGSKIFRNEIYAWYHEIGTPEKVANSIDELNDE